jgi:hypothetical protein
MSAPRQRTYDVVGGRPVPDVSGLDGPAALARKREVEAGLAATRNDPSKAAERERLRAEDAALARRLTELREQQKAQNTRRTFAGLTSPLFEAVAARFDAGTVAELEADALARFDERLRQNAERKARKDNP